MRLGKVGGEGIFEGTVGGEGKMCEGRIKGWWMEVKS
jgi:hypothetical protein